MRILITCDAESDALLLEELRRSALVSDQCRWLDTGDAVQGSILLAETDLEFTAFSLELERSGSMFARHLAPVDHEVALSGTEADLQALTSLIPMLASEIDPAASFSVQSRIVGTGKLPYRKVVLNETLSNALERISDSVMDCREPELVVSIFCTPETAYVGVSRTKLNRSAWPGGKHRFRREEEQVSRAEFKLLEAISVFGLVFPTKGQALDIGASPGGWSRVLADHGLKVDAVDPGDLDPRLRSNRSITHVRRRIQEYRPGPKEFAVIVNDMKMDARDSIEIMLSFSRRLQPGGLAVVTLKMPKSGDARVMIDMLRDDLDRLSSGFEVIGARQLYHNRSEVTVALRRAPS